MSTDATDAFDPGAVAAAIGHTFADPERLKTALTHRSWAHENGGGPDNERLEFLGDAVLSASATALLIDRYPHAAEGDLSRVRSRLVSTDALAGVGRDLGLGRQLRLGRGEEATGGREKTSVLADATEALLGALFLDAGFEVCRGVVARWLLPRLDEIDRDSPVEAWKDARSQLQEETWRRFREHPTYDVVSVEGPSHAPIFEVAVRVGAERYGCGRGPSKREAARAAAADALVRLGQP